MLKLQTIQKIAILVGLSISLVACRASEEDFSATAEGGAGAGSTVTVMGIIIGEQQKKLEKALAPFEQETGIDVIYEGTDAFATLLPIRVDAGNPPDIAMFAQPGLLTDLAREGQLVPLETFMDIEKFSEAYSQDWIDMATIDGTLYGIWYRALLKSMVWYSPAAFESRGYEIPKTWDELLALTAQIVADGGVPWCLGMESGDATGWVGTDWVENIMLRIAGSSGYDQWITNEIPFDHPSVKAAFEKFGEIVLNPNYVVGGTVGVISTPFGDSPLLLFDDPPGCYLHVQSSIITSFFPGDIVVGEDVDFFPLPGIQAEFGLPILVSGDIFAVLNNTSEARALMEYLATPKPHEIWASLGGYLSPHNQVNLDAYIDEVAKRQAETILDAETVRFDGSDMMPGTVGTGTFWTGVTDYVGGADLDAVLSDIQASWPK